MGQNGPKKVPADAVKPFGHSQKGIGPRAPLVVDLPKTLGQTCPPSETGGKPMFRTKSVVAAFSVATMIATSAFAAETAPLAPGKPAGVHKADLGLGTGTVIIGLGAIAIITAIAITVGNQSGNNVATGSLGQGGSSTPGTTV